MTTDELLDLLSEWQSLHAILPTDMQARLNHLNELTLQALEAGSE